MTSKLNILWGLMFLLPAAGLNAKEYELASPDGQMKVIVNADKQLTWEVNHGSTQVITTSPISLSLTDGKVLGKQPKVAKASRQSIKSQFDTPVYKKASVEDNYNELTLKMKGDYSVVFRAYNDGAAYRILLGGKGEKVVADEEAVFNFAGDYDAFIPYVNDLRDSSYPYSFSFESYYDESPISKMYADSLSIVPLLVKLPDGKKALIMEGDLEEYPGMFLVKGANANSIEGHFAPVALSEKIGGYNKLNLVPTSSAPYIAKITGETKLPWRAVAVSTDDRQLANNDMAQRLASPSRVQDMSWIKLGKVAWDWWNNWNIIGVDFPAGINTDTYKHYLST